MSSWFLRPGPFAQFNPHWAFHIFAPKLCLGRQKQGLGGCHTDVTFYEQDNCCKKGSPSPQYRNGHCKSPSQASLGNAANEKTNSLCSNKENIYVLLWLTYTLSRKYFSQEKICAKKRVPLLCPQIILFCSPSEASKSKAAALTFCCRS